MLARALFLATLFLFAGETAAQTAQNRERIALNLPFASHAHPELAKALQAYLNDNDLNQFRVETADYWHEYQQGIRTGKAGVYLAAPHFAAWAVAKHKFQPLLRLSSPLSYVIAARRSDPDVFEINDLANLPVCAPKPLNLGYLLINTSFYNNVLSADIKVVPSVPAEMARSKESQCRGFSLTSQQFEQIDKTQPNHYIRLEQSIKLNNLAWLADPTTVSQHGDLVKRVQAALSSDQGRQILAPYTSEHSPTSHLVVAKAGDYPARYFRELANFWRNP